MDAKQAAHVVTAIPEVLKGVPQWLAWIPSGPKKLPIGDDGKPLEHWPKHPSAFADALSRATKFKNAQLGFLHGGGWGGIDLDDCRKPDGTLDPRAQLVLDQAGAYAEVSPSGKGVKIFGGMDGWVELNFSSTDRVTCVVKSDLYFAVTGEVIVHKSPDIDLRPLVPQLLQFFSGETAKAQEDSGHHELPETIVAGTQNDTLFREACKHRADGKSEDEVFHILMAIRHRCTPVPSERDLRGIAHSASRYDPNAESAVRLEDFYSYMPMHNYLHIPTGGTPWPGSSVNARLKSVPVGKDAEGKSRYMRPANWLDANRPVEQMTWWPGKPGLIEDFVYSAGALVEHKGMRCYNTYRPPTISGGDPDQAAPWLELVRKLYPSEADHILYWLAHRVQFPDRKCNHAIVLGGSPGIGKDTILEPVRTAVGSSNMQEVSPSMVVGRFTAFLKSVILRISEARDLGETDRYAFYEHMKVYISAPPETLRVDEKHLREYEIPNIVGVIMTTNHRTNGIYLPPDDRRHFVAWSEVTRDAFTVSFWVEHYNWLESGGRAHVAAWLRQHDLSKFDAKAPPPKTEAFWAIADANAAPEDDEMSAALGTVGHPAALVVDDLTCHPEVSPEFKSWLVDRRNSRSVPHRFEGSGYVSVRNDKEARGRWKVSGRERMIYCRADLSVRERVSAARERAVQQLDLLKPPFVKG